MVLTEMVKCNFVAKPTILSGISISSLQLKKKLMVVCKNALGPTGEMSVGIDSYLHQDTLYTDSFFAMNIAGVWLHVSPSLLFLSLAVIMLRMGITFCFCIIPIVFSSNAVIRWGIRLVPCFCPVTHPHSGESLPLPFQSWWHILFWCSLFQLWQQI